MEGEVEGNLQLHGLADVLRAQAAVLRRHPIDVFLDNSLADEAAGTLRRWAASVERVAAAALAEEARNTSTDDRASTGGRTANVDVGGGVEGTPSPIETHIVRVLWHLLDMGTSQQPTPGAVPSGAGAPGASEVAPGVASAPPASVPPTSPPACIDDVLDTDLLALVREVRELLLHRGLGVDAGAADPAPVVGADEAAAAAAVAASGALPGVLVDEIVERIGLAKKKRHEVTMLARTIGDIIHEHRIDLVVDVGSGQGYLSIAVAMLSGVTVVGIDSAAHNTAAAVKRKAHATRRGLRPIPCDFHAVTHGIARGEDFTHVLAPFMDGGDPAKVAPAGGGEAPRRRILLLGLHACGDLTSTFLRLAAGPLRSHVVAVMSVGCCYQILTERCAQDVIDAVGTKGAVHRDAGAGGPNAADAHPSSAAPTGLEELLPSATPFCYLSRISKFDTENDHTLVPDGTRGDNAFGGAAPVVGFPLSSVLKGQARGVVLGRRTRILTAQRLSMRPDDLHWTLRRSFYRSIFQRVAYHELGGMLAPHKLGVRSKDGMRMTLADYMRAAAEQCVEKAPGTAVASGTTDRLVAAAALVADAFAHQRTALYLLHTLRIMLGHVVESLVLVDRAAFLREHGYASALRVVFDGAESPRNIALVGWRV